MAKPQPPDIGEQEYFLGIANRSLRRPHRRGQKTLAVGVISEDRPDLRRGFAALECDNRRASTKLGCCPRSNGRLSPPGQPLRSHSFTPPWHVVRPTAAAGTR